VTTTAGGAGGGGGSKTGGGSGGRGGPGRPPRACTGSEDARIADVASIVKNNFERICFPFFLYSLEETGDG